MQRRTILSLALATVLGALSAPGFAALTEGKEYNKYPKAFPTDSGNKIEVIEFFSFGCPHCQSLEPHIQKWLAKLPPDVHFRRIPVVFNPSWEGFSKAYFTLENLGVENKLAHDVFNAIHVENKKLNDAKVFLEWATAKGLDKDKVDGIYKSFTINSKLNRAKTLVQDYKIESVPSVVVNGRFMTAPSKISNGNDGFIDALNQVIDLARKDKK
ncbi:MAG: hypothetical protein RLZZ502_1480 [Pseudomonadota bacterium]|jgi:thiol:disulfide interchange protein DsbA